MIRDRIHNYIFIVCSRGAVLLHPIKLFIILNAESGWVYCRFSSKVYLRIMDRVKARCSQQCAFPQLSLPHFCRLVLEHVLEGTTIRRQFIVEKKTQVQLGFTFAALFTPRFMSAILAEGELGVQE